jgi:hypothetical protein
VVWPVYCLQNWFKEVRSGFNLLPTPKMLEAFESPSNAPTVVMLPEQVMPSGRPMFQSAPLH